MYTIPVLVELVEFREKASAGSRRSAKPINRGQLILPQYRNCIRGFKHNNN